MLDIVERERDRKEVEELALLLMKLTPYKRAVVRSGLAMANVLNLKEEDPEKIA